MDLEPRRSAFSRCHPDRGPIPWSPASLGLGPPPLPWPGCPPETVDLASSAQTGRRNNRETGSLFRLPCNLLARAHRNDPQASRLLPTKRRADALSRVPSPTSFLRFGGHRATFHTPHWQPPPTLRLLLTCP